MVAINALPYYSDRYRFVGCSRTVASRYARHVCMLAYSSLENLSSFLTLDGLLGWTLIFSLPHRFSVEVTSGLCAGHVHNVSYRNSLFFDFFVVLEDKNHDPDQVYLSK